MCQVHKCLDCFISNNAHFLNNEVSLFKMIYLPSLTGTGTIIQAPNASEGIFLSPLIV